MRKRFRNKEDELGYIRVHLKRFWLARLIAGALAILIGIVLLQRIERGLFGIFFVGFGVILILVLLITFIKAKKRIKFLEQEMEQERKN